MVKVGEKLLIAVKVISITETESGIFTRSLRWIKSGITTR